MPGETKTIQFVIVPEAFSMIDENNKQVILPGSYEISVGGGQPNNKAILGNITREITLVK